MADLCAPGGDSLWAATAAGLCRIDRYTIRCFAASDGAPAGAPFALAAAGPDAVFAFFPGSLARVSGGRFEKLAIPPEAAPSTPACVVGDRGALFVLAGDRVHRRDPAGSWSSLPLPASAPAPGCLGIDGGVLLCGGATGVWEWVEAAWRRRAGDAGTTRLPRGGGDRVPAALGDAGATACVRHAGMIWCATSRLGILRRGETPRFRTIGLPLSSRVHAIAQDVDGSIWCGTERGLAHVAGGPVESLPSLDGETLGTVTACAVDRQGRLWIGSGSAFTGVYRRDGGRWTHIGRAEGFLDAYVHRITVDPSGAIWFSVLNAAGGAPSEGEGAWVYGDGGFRPSPAHRELPSGRVYDVVARDPEGVLWFATLKGLAAYDGRQVTLYSSGVLSGERVWCLCAARDGSLWIGYQTGEHGVTRLSRGRARQYGATDGLGSANVWSIAEGERGVFWFAAENGLGRHDGKRWSHFSSSDGLPAAPLWPLLPTADGALWIGTLGGGLVRMEPGDRSGPRTRFVAPPATAVSGEGALVRWSGADAWFDTPSSDLWYRWRLDEGAWSDAAPGTGHRFDGTPGDHRIQVQAIDRFGNAEDPPAELRVRFTRPFPYGWVVAGAVAAAVTVAVLRLLRPRWESRP